MEVMHMVIYVWQCMVVLLYDGVYVHGGCGL